MPVYDDFLLKFKNIYRPEQNLSLDEAMIPWRGRLALKVYNSSKISKYGILARMLCEAKSGYIHNIQLIVVLV